MNRSLCWVPLLSLLWLTPASACGPFLFDNTDLDRFSLLEPGIVNPPTWQAFLDFSPPSIGHAEAPGSTVVQYVLSPSRLSLTASSQVSNLLYDFEPGADPVSVEANEAWWSEYFLTVRHRRLDAQEREALLYQGHRPAWLASADRAYLDALTRDPQDPATLRLARTNARDARLPEPLRHRWAFWWIRALALGQQPDTLAVFREFSPGPASDLPLARAQGWAASVVARQNPQQAIALWADLLVRWPALRAQSLGSLALLPPEAWEGVNDEAGLVARFLVLGRDFSPETLRAVARAEHRSGANHGSTETVLFSMAQQVEAESGVFALVGLVDPHEDPPRGLFTALIDEAEALVDEKTVVATRTWWTLAAYLCLFDGDAERAEGFLARAVALEALSAAQDEQFDLVETLVQMQAQRDQDWSTSLQARVVKVLDWTQTLNGPGTNRGLYHSVAVLALQKALARGHHPEAALVLGLLQEGPWSNPYRLQVDDWFWAVGYPSNNSTNLLFDALLSDDDLQAWKSLLVTRDLPPLTARLVAHPFVSVPDLTWWQAHRALRRGDGREAERLLTTLGDQGPATAIFPAREFSYSLDLDPLRPSSGQGLVTVSARKLATVMTRVQAEAQTRGDAKSLLAEGEFWFSLQLSGLPLLFSQPPRLISFVNENFEYYGYDGRDSERSTDLVNDYPLGPSGPSEAWAQRLEAFYTGEFSALGRARHAFEAVLTQGDDPDAEYRALLFLQALVGDRRDQLVDQRFDHLPLATAFLSTCEAFQ